MTNKLFGLFKNHFKFKLSIFMLSFTIFPFLVVFGTLSHELGHILVAKLLGFETILHYGSMDWFSDGKDGNLVETDLKNLLVALGGPIQTILTGTLGLILLKKKPTKKLKWIAIFLTFFWSRQVINLLIGITNGLFFNQSFFGGDELFISDLLNLPSGFFSVVLGFAGIVVCLYATSKININERLSFLFAGLISGVLTYILWFGYLGKLILP